MIRKIKLRKNIYLILLLLLFISNIASSIEVTNIDTLVLYHTSKYDKIDGLVDYVKNYAQFRNIPYNEYLDLIYKQFKVRIHMDDWISQTFCERAMELFADAKYEKAQKVIKDKYLISGGTDVGEMYRRKFAALYYIAIEPEDLREVSISLLNNHVFFHSIERIEYCKALTKYLGQAFYRNSNISQIRNDLRDLVITEIDHINELPYLNNPNDIKEYVILLDSLLASADENYQKSIARENILRKIETSPKRDNTIYPEVTQRLCEIGSIPENERTKIIIKSKSDWIKE